MWNSLEVTKLIISILIPISVVLFGWIINRRLKHFEQRQRANQMLIEKRLDLYDDIAPLLNKLLCFYIFVGAWKDITPQEARETKWTLDQKVHIYRYLLGESFFEEYQDFIRTLFKEWQGHGVTASLKTMITTERGSRKTDSHYDWKSEWDTWFDEDNSPAYAEIEVRYAKVLHALKDTIEK